MPKFTRDDVDKLFDYDISLPHRTIYMGSTETDLDGNESGVDANMAERVIKGLLLLDQKQEDITIIMNNLGGDWYHGMAIYDAIKACKSHVTIKVFGSAMSMGAVILQAADKRILAPNSRVMIHYGYDGMLGHSRTVQKWAEEFKKINKEMEKILLDKIHDQHPSFTLKQLEDMLDHDTILSADDAIKLGLADEKL